MTINEQVALATDKVAHWNSKRDHAQAMLTKWQDRFSALQSKGKSQQTAKLLPKLELVPGSPQHLMPKTAIKTVADQAAEQHAAREAALRDMAEEAGDKVAPKKNKTPKAKAKK